MSLGECADTSLFFRLSETPSPGGFEVLDAIECSDQSQLLYGDLRRSSKDEQQEDASAAEGYAPPIPEWSSILSREQPSYKRGLHE
jgi:hypothetical protein